jgi:type I restriction-modification system DNA methylase subunit
MNTGKIQQFSDMIREKLHTEIKQRAAFYGIFPDEIKPVEQEYHDSIIIHGKPFDKKIKDQRNRLIKEIEEKGYDHVIDEVTYTWFNRFIALRFMEINQYIPIRVVSSRNHDSLEPDILRNVMDIAFFDIDHDHIIELRTQGKNEELYKYLILQLCHYLNHIMPFLFEPIDDYTELLFPEKLLHTDSILQDIQSIIDESDWKEVEIIGWIYEFYIRHRKDEVFASLSEGKKIEKEDIPAATAIFTPKWIVQYMVENSLGRMWLESNPNEELKKKWKYFIEQEQTGPANKIYDPKEIRILDPAMGSGHMLVYAYEVLFQIYVSQGYLEDEIAEHILNQNLYGLEVDDRSAQLAGFALMMKARSHDEDLFSKKIHLNLSSIQETTSELTFDEKRYSNLTKLWKSYLSAKNFGSILKIDELNIQAIESEIENLRREQSLRSFFSIEKITYLLKQYLIMKEKYDCVITNPPYMGSKGMNKELSWYVKKEYPETKRDMFAVFIDGCLEYTKKNGFTSMITMQSWMFLSSFEQLRKRILEHHIIDTMVHLGPHAFEQIGGEVVSTTSFVLRK